MNCNQEGADVARIKMLQPGDRNLEMPDVTPFGYLIDLLSDVGPLSRGEPVTWGDIKSWRSETKTLLSVWEKRMLKNLSNVYYQASKDFVDKVIPSPIESKSEDVMKLAKNIKAAFRQIAPGQNNGR